MKINQRKSSPLILFLLILVLCLSAVSGDYRSLAPDSLISSTGADTTRISDVLDPQTELATISDLYPASLTIVPVD